MDSNCRFYVRPLHFPPGGRFDRMWRTCGKDTETFLFEQGNTIAKFLEDKSWHLQSKLEGSEGLLEARFPLLRSAKLCFLQLWPRFSEKRVFPQTTDFEPRIRHVRENMLECRASVLGVWMKQFADFRCYFQSTWPVFCRWQTSVTTFLGMRTPS